MTVKTIVSYFLILLVLVFTVIGILGIWDVIDLDQVLQKILSSLIVIFAASAVVLFIFAVLIREPENKKE
ncbi:MAG: hypothetical protein KAX05_08240 [Bacteroidales bacterium]|nr:hypothetical protein [Bacteroidales bacterium]